MMDQNFTMDGEQQQNDAPTITSTALTSVTEDSAYSYTFTVSDVDAGDSLTLSAPTLPAWLSFDAGTGVLSGTPSKRRSGRSQRGAAGHRWYDECGPELHHHGEQQQ